MCTVVSSRWIISRCNWCCAFTNRPPGGGSLRPFSSTHHITHACVEEGYYVKNKTVHIVRACSGLWAPRLVTTKAIYHRVLLPHLTCNTSHHITTGHWLLWSGSKPLPIHHMPTFRMGRVDGVRQTLSLRFAFISRWVADRIDFTLLFFPLLRISPHPYLRWSEISAIAWQMPLASNLKHERHTNWNWLQEWQIIWGLCFFDVVLRHSLVAPGPHEKKKLKETEDARLKAHPPQNRAPRSPKIMGISLPYCPILVQCVNHSPWVKLI